MTYRKIETTRVPKPSSMGPDVRQVMPSTIADIDPFVFLDHYGPFEKQAGWEGVPPHPHAGISTITYLLEGTNRHQDSIGNNEVAHKGDLAWMRAGKGIIHAEGYFGDQTDSEISHGIQFWISLPAEHKFTAPDFFHYSASQLPMVDKNGVQIKVLAGELFGHQSPAKSLSPLFMYDIKMTADQIIEVPIKEGDNCGLYVIKGEVFSNGKALKATTISKYKTVGDAISIKANKDSRIMVFGGTPLNEPIVGYASYVMNNEDQIKKVMMDYKNGEMGRIKK